MNCNPPGTSVHGILQARILEWVAISFSKWSSQPRDQIQVSRIAGGFFTNWATRDTQPPGQAIKLELSHKKKREKCTFLFYTLSQPASLIFHIIILSSEQDSSLSQSRKDILGTVVAGGLGPPILSKNRASQGVRPTYTHCHSVADNSVILTLWYVLHSSA